LKEVGLSSWKSPNYAACDQIGFTALPSGKFNGDFRYFGEYGFWFSSTGERSLYIFNVSYGSDSFGISSEVGNEGVSVRCIKD